MAEREILGHIDCPTCGMVGGMRFTPDKNGDPFGFCEAGCDQQLRVGGKSRRVAAFYARYPQIKRPGTVTEPERRSYEGQKKVYEDSVAEPKPQEAEPPAPPARKSTGNPLLDFALGGK